MVSFDVVCKAHGATAVFFGLVFVFAAFGYSLPYIGPAALLVGWDVTDNEALKFTTLFLAGTMFGIGYFEWVMADHEKTKDIFVRYHAVLFILTDVCYLRCSCLLVIVALCYLGCIIYDRWIYWKACWIQQCLDLV